MLTPYKALPSSTQPSSLVVAAAALGLEVSNLPALPVNISNTLATH